MKGIGFRQKRGFSPLVNLFMMACFLFLLIPDAPSQTLPLIGLLENPIDNRSFPLGMPIPYQPFSGITTIHGWALDGKGVTKIELFIDNQFVANIPYGGTRMDVEAAYPDYPNAENSGFAMIWNYSILPPGAHGIKVAVYNQDGQTLDLLAAVYVKKFQGEFVTQMVPQRRMLYGNSVTADGVKKNYHIEIQWSNEIQGFQITDIIEK